MSTGFHYEILKCLLKESAWLEPPLLHNERGLPHKFRISAFWLFSWDSAVLVPEIHPSPALLQHSGCFLGFLLFWCRRSTLLRHCFSILAVFLGFCCSAAGDPPFSGTVSAFWLFSSISDEQEAVAQATASCCKNQLCNLQKSYRIIHSSQSEPFRRVRVS